MGVRIITSCGKDVSDNDTCNRGNGHAEQLQTDNEWVDLGLPSGVLWAKCNIGAFKPEEYGDYYAWGETKPKKVYDWTNYLYCNGAPNQLTKYCNDAKLGHNGYTDRWLTRLQMMDDAATQVSGGLAYIPTDDQWRELIDFTYRERTTINGIKVLRFTSPNGNCLILPAAGTHVSEKIRGANMSGCYWCATLGPSQPNYALFFDFLEGYGFGCARCIGLSVRAVCNIFPSRFFQI